MFQPFKTAVIPTNGTNEIQTLTIGGTPTAGTFTITYGGKVTSAITWSATNATLFANMQTALDAILGTNNTLVANLSCTSGIGTINITYQNALGKMPASFLATAQSSLTGTSPTAAITRATLGIMATQRGAGPGDTMTFTGVNNVNAIQTITIGGTPTSGTFTVTGGTAQNPTALLTTAAITWSATNATLLSNAQSAFDTTFGSANTLVSLGTITSGIGTLTVQFIGTNAYAAMPLFTATSSLSGTAPTIAITSTTTGGVASTRAGYPVTYVNQSTTQFAPNWLPGQGNVTLALGSPAVGAATAVHAAVTDTGSTITITTAITNPDVPRAILLTPGGTTANVTATTCDIIGTDCNGNPLTETTAPFTAGAATAVTTINAFKTVTSIVQRTTGASVTISYGTTTKIGLGFPLTLNSVVNGWLAGALESTRPVAVPGAQLSLNLVSITSALSSSSALKISVQPT